MSASVADTHAVIWYILDQKALSADALEAFENAAQSGDPVYVSAISFVEICYLVEKGKLSRLFADRLDKALAAMNAVLVAILVTLDIARTVNQVPRGVVPDMPDRIIAATSLHLNLPLITRDAKIQASGIKTIW
jgi:PIN domain nuclease of toxin-antitoxin system